MLNSIIQFIRLLFCKKLIIVSSTLQMLSLSEFIHARKAIHEDLNNFIIVCTYANKEAYQKIITCYRELIKKDNLILNFHKKIQIKILYLIFHLKNLFSLEIDQIIIGNYYSYLNRKFTKISRETFVLDDGTNILEKKNIKLLKNSKFLFFSFFNKKIFSKKNNFIKNNFNFLKKKFIHKKKYSDDILILGTPFVEIDFLKEHQYEFLINFIKKFYKNKKIIYFPHPKEKKNSVVRKKFKTIRIIKSKYPVEIYFLKVKKFPKTVISFGSSAIILLKKFNKELNIININYEIKPDNTYHGAHYITEKKKVVDYLKSQLSIKSIKVKIKN